MSEPVGPKRAAAPPGDADDWDQHWTRYAGAAAQNPAQAFRRRLVLRALAVEGRRAKLLDIGSGTGDLAAELARELPEPEILGVELSATGVEIATAKVPGARFRELDLLGPPPADDADAGWAEYAVCSEVLEHVDDPALLIANARALMAPGCRLVVTVPGGPMSAFDRHIGHRRHFDRAALAAVLERAGFEQIDVRAAGFPAFNLYRLLVIAAGRRLIEAAERGDEGAEPGAAMRIVARVFEPLMRLNMNGRRLGYQLVALARSAA